MSIRTWEATDISIIACCRYPPAKRKHWTFICLWNSEISVFKKIIQNLLTAGSRGKVHNVVWKYSHGTLSCFLFSERNAGVDGVGDCVEHGGMKRQLRSGNLNNYLFNMVRCLASASRPRYGFSVSGKKERSSILKLILFSKVNHQNNWNTSQL